MEETYKVLKDEYLQLVATEIIPIHHCLFKKRGSKKIDTIASHPQALKQTKNNRNLFFSDCNEMETSDTALAAEWLEKGVLTDNIAVLCRKNAGERNNLELVMENMEDEQNNRTEFRILKLPEID